MKEYQNLLAHYQSDRYLMFSNSISQSDWGDEQVAQRYMEQFWLDRDEFQSNWSNILQSIFVGNQITLPEMVIQDGFELVAQIGGCLFVQEEYEALQKSMQEIGDRFFLVLQNQLDGDRELCFRMKFPVDITWEKLMSGNFISTVLFEMPRNEFFVLGDRGLWGKYAASDYHYPLDILGFRPSVSKCFERFVVAAETEAERLLEWLPASYKQHVKKLR